MKKQLVTATTAVVLGTTLFAGAASAQTIKVKKAIHYGDFQIGTERQLIPLNLRIN